MIIQFMGLPGSGVAEIADAVSERINGIYLNSDHVRSAISSDSHFHIEQQTEYARKLGELARFLESYQDAPVVVEFTFGTQESRDAFGDSDIFVWVDTTNITNTVWESTDFLTPPSEYDHKISIVGEPYEDSLPVRAITVIRKFGILDWKEDAVFIINKFQSFTNEDFLLYEKAKALGKNVVFAVRHTVGMSDQDTKFYKDICQEIYQTIPDANIIRIPNITNLVIEEESNYETVTF
jgi:hypothetical protein